VSRGLYSGAIDPEAPFWPIDLDLRAVYVTARDRESLDALGLRVGNTWSTTETAANVLPVDTQLTAGQLLKVEVARPYARP
jgi:hypothetical protein